MSAPAREGYEGLLRELAPRALAALARRHNQFDACDDAVQEALLAASEQWPEQGQPENPLGWLVAVATRRLIDMFRSDRARHAREEVTVVFEESAGPGDEEVPMYDDTLTLLFLCCHPALTPASQIALTLRAVAGLTTAEIASGFLVPESTMAQRISRAKQTINARGARFEPPLDGERDQRVAAVRHVLYLLFNEGYTASGGPQLQRVDLAEEAIRLARMLNRLLPSEGESVGLLALMLLTHARSAARVDATGAIVALADQDQLLWNRTAIAEGASLIEQALSSGIVGPYQLQAAIAAVHCEATCASDTDWRQILALYTLLERTAPNPVFSLNRAVAIAMVDGPRAGLAELTAIERDPRLAGHFRLRAVRGHMLELIGDPGAAAEQYRAAARLTTSLPERRYLESRASSLGE